MFHPYVDGGFRIKNCSYQRTNNSIVYVGSSDDPGTAFISSIPSKLNTANFSWKTEDELPPYEVQCFELNELEAILNHSIYGCGTTTALQQMLLKKQY